MKIDFPKYSIIYDYVIKNLRLVYSFDLNLSTLYVQNNSNYKKYFKKIFDVEPIFFEWRDYTFPVFIHQNETALYTENGEISFDIFLNIFLFLSGWQEIVCKKRDAHHRFPYSSSLLYKYDFVNIPVVNIYYELLYETAKRKGLNIGKKKFDSPIIFTHDIDQLRSGWFENIIYSSSHFSLKSFFAIPKNLIIKLLKLEDGYLKGLKKMLEIDKENGIKGISFFIPKRSHQDADFNLSDKKYLGILETTKETQKIGIHPGYETFRNKDNYARQLYQLEKLSNLNIKKSRQHFLQYEILETPYIQDKLKIAEDYTLGFAEQYGFRNGIANTFYLFNFKEERAFKVKQIPLVFMDVSLVNYSLEKDFKEVLTLLEKTIQNFNCNFSILFHNSVFSEGKYAGFENFYKELIRISKKDIIR